MPAENGTVHPLHHSMPIPNEGEDNKADVLFYKNNVSMSSRTHEHLRRSGPLARCDNPYCSTCDKYRFSLANTHQQSLQISSGRKGMLQNLRDLCRFCLNGTINPHTKTVQRWNKFFVVACLVAIFVDPLFFLLFSVDLKYTCITFNRPFAKVVTILRSITDFIYFIHMLLQFKLAIIVPPSKASGMVELIDNPREVAEKYLRGWFGLDLIVVLPMPQIMLWFVALGKGKTNANFVKNILRVTLLLQSVPRCIRFLPLVSGHSQIGFIFETAWADIAINLLMYLLAAHVVGACWYLFGLQRVNECLHRNCYENLGCKKAFLDCGDGGTPENKSWDNSNASENCLTNPTFAYGIYGSSVPVTMKPNIIVKYFYSLFWGFLQLSTLAGNLQPSLFIWEVFFTMLIIGLGLLLFTLLIGNVQNFLQSLGRRQMDMQLRRDDVKNWMRRRNLPVELRKKVQQAERYKWAATRGVDEDELLEDLPEDLHREIRRKLALHYLKKVRVFQVMNEDVLDAILERLHQKVYIEKSIIMRPRYPIDRMLFIVRGRILSVGEDNHPIELSGGSFCGEELLTSSLQQAFESGGSGKMKSKNFSTRTVTCLTNVEAFSLEAEDLEFVVNHFSHNMRDPRVQGAIKYESHYFKTRAARKIQRAWRNRMSSRNQTMLSEDRS